jgi:hypothetical protein
VAGRDQVFDDVISALLVHLEEILSKNGDVNSFPLFIFRYHLYSYMRSGYAPNVLVFHSCDIVSASLMYELFWPKWCLLVFKLERWMS